MLSGFVDLQSLTEHPRGRPAAATGWFDNLIVFFLFFCFNLTLELYLFDLVSVFLSSPVSGYSRTVVY